MDTQTQNSTLPSINQLFKDSWQSLVQSILPLFILNVLGIVLYIGLGLLAVVIFIISGAGSFLLKNGFSNLGTDLFTAPSLIITAIVIFLILIIVYAIIGSALQSASIFLIDSQGKTSLSNAFKKGLSLVLPLFVVNFLIFILIIGGLALLILPALLFFLLLMFAQFEVVLGSQRGLEALKRSVLIVSKNFGAIFIRLLVFFLLYVGIFIIVGIVENSTPEGAEWVGSVLTFIPNMILGWFALAYSIILYKHASLKFKQEKGKGIAWIWIVALIGWVIIIGLSFLGYKTVSSGILNNIFNNSKPPSNTIIQPNSPSSQFIQSGLAKLSSANQIATKPNLTNEEKNQVKTLIQEALSTFNAAIEKYPNNSQAWYYRGQAYKNLIGVAQNADSFAIESYDKAIALNPSDYQTYLERGGVYYYLKQYNKAIENFQQVTKLAPKYANGYFNLGVAYKQAGAKDSARKALEKAMELLDKDDPTRYKAESELNSL